MVTRREILIVVLVFLCLSMIMTYPLCTRMFTHVPGLLSNPDGDSLSQDSYLFIWNFWWARKALVSGAHDLFQTNYLYYPFSVNLYFHTFVPLKSITAAVMETVLPGIVVYNIHFFLTFILTGLGIYLWVNFMLEDKRAAFFAALAFTFSSYRMVHAPFHLNIISTEGMAFFLYFFHRFLQEKSFRSGTGAAVSFAWTFYCSPFYALCLVLYGTGFILYRFFRGITWFHPSMLKPALLFCGSAFILIAPLVIPMMSELGSGNFARLPGETVHYRLKPAACVVPSSMHTVWGSHTWPWYRDPDVAGYFIEGTGFLGYITLILACVGLIRLRNKSWGFFPLCAIIFYVLCLGPYWDREHSIRLPFYFLSKIPFFQTLRTPGRFQILVLISIVLLAANGFRIISPMRNHARKIFFVSIIILSMIELTILPFPVVQPHIPEALNIIKKDGETVSVLDIPVNPSLRRYQLYQTIHEKPLLNGYLARVPAEFLALYPDLPLMKMVKTPLDPDPYLNNPKILLMLKDVASYVNLKYITLHREFMDESAYRTWNIVLADTACMTHIYSDPRISLFTINYTMIPEPENLLRWYTIKGFSPREWGGDWNRTFMWSNGRESLILIHVPPPGSKIHLSFEAFPITDMQAVWLFIDDTPFCRLPFQEGWHPYNLELPFLKMGNHQISFRYDYLVPENLAPHYNAIPRQLGAAFSNMELKLIEKQNGSYDN